MNTQVDGGSAAQRLGDALRWFPRAGYGKELSAHGLDEYSPQFKHVMVKPELAP